MARFTRFFMLLAFMLAMNTFSSSAKPAPGKPDFAYPEDVTAAGEKSLAEALAARDYPKALSSIINMSLAQSAISADRLPAQIDRIEKLRDESSDPAFKALLNSLLARIYSDVYNDDRWKYDDRDLPLTPLPEDYTLWSGEQFKHHIASLVNLSLADADALKKIPLREWAGPVVVDNASLVYYPTLYDFIASSAIDRLEICLPNDWFLSFGLLTRSDVYVTRRLNASSPEITKILSLYADLLRFHENDIAPFIHTDIARIDFVADHVYADDESDNVSTRRQQLMMDLYDRFRDSEYSGDVLNEMPIGSYTDVAGEAGVAAPLDMSDEELMLRRYYDAVVRNIDRFPAYAGINCLKNILNSLNSRNISVRLPECAAPGATVKITVTSRNVTSAHINIYDVSSSSVADETYTYNPAQSHKLVRSIPVTFSGERPFNLYRTVEFSFPSTGNYIVVPVIDGIAEKKQNYSKIHVTRLSLASSTFMESRLWVIDPLDGTPVSNAKLTKYTEQRNIPKTEEIGRTDNNGSFPFSTDSWCKVLASKGTDKFAEPISIWNNRGYNPDEKWITAIQGYTSLPIYHPGDSVEWVAVVYEYKSVGKERRVKKNTPVTAILRNASYESIDTLKLVTDDFGRVHGTFRIPAESMTGNFNIRFDEGQISFMVSDYKLPTFQVTTLPVEKDVPAAGAVTLRGKVMTYSGFPVSDARVTIDLSASRSIVWWRNYSRPVSFYSTEVTTGPDGSFSAVVSADILENSPIPGGVFTANYTALSSTGESQDASIRFMTGTRYSIESLIENNYDISRPVTLDVKVVDYNDSIISLPVNYRLVSGKDTVASGTFTGPKPVVDFSAVKSGRYELVLTLDNPSLADAVTDNVILYRPTDALSPVPDELFWTPQGVTLKVEKGKKGQMLYATGFDAHLLVTLTSAGEMIEQKWVKAPAGMHTLPVSLPSDVRDAGLSVLCVGNYQTSQNTYEVQVAEPKPSIEFEIETFRDHVVPGSQETWTFRVKDEKGDGTRSAVILDMYNQALDELAKQSWRLYPRTGFTPQFYMNGPSLSSTSHSRVAAPGSKQLKCVSITDPHFELWNMGFGVRTMYRFNNMRLRGTMKATAYDAGVGTDDLGVVREHKAEAVVEEAEDFAAVPTEVFTEALSGQVSGLSVNNDAPKMLASVVGPIEVAPIGETPFTYRDGETPLAFFRPMLTTDADGRLSFSFTVPNANTTWSFNALAFTDKLLTTTASTTVLANKPIMVQPNLPRFLRTGDRAVILASVMNNSDSVQAVHTVVEIFDAVSGAVTAAQSSDDVIEPGKSATVSTTLSVPMDSPFIGYRVKSSTADFADGEQSLIPVQPSTTPVIETVPFYLQPSEADFSMKLPSMPADARVTLQFCENPAWYVVTALPGLLNLEPSTANEAGAAIFSAAIADGLLRSNPVIADALREWQRSDRSDSTLVSMLERNADLKIVLLNATPWMMDARSDTERMTRLSLLFDKKQIKNVYSTSVALLKRLERGSGWAWYDKCTEASQWSTENILLMMGRLAALGYLPDNSDLRAMMTRSVKWIDEETAKAYREYPKGDYTLYTYLRTLYPDVKQSTAAAAVSNAMVQRIVAEWKKGSIFDKGVYALILANRGNKGVAGQIIESLRQYAETSPTKGMWWPSLDNMTLWSMDKVGTTAVLLEAFHAVDPGCKDIDMIRQWLILQKEAKDWGTSVTTTEVIASILATSGRWVAPAQGATVRVGESVVEPDKVEKITGYFRTDISSLSPSGATLSVNKPGDAPSWGAVYCQFTDVMADVKAASCDAVSVEKKLLLVNSTPDGVTTAEISGPLATGNKVRVLLTIKVGRDMDYVAVVDDRPACFEPVEQLPTPIFAEGIYFYRENRDSATKIFIDHLPKGTYQIGYDMWVNNAGEYASGIATVQSQYAPQLTAHSAGSIVKVE